MPGGFASLDTGFPNLSTIDGNEKKLKAIEDYLVLLLEQLRYTLNNLSQDNFNVGEVSGWLGETITEPIRIEIQDVEQGLSTEIIITAEGIKSVVSQSLAQYDTGSVTVDQYGFGPPTGTAESGTIYLDQSTGDYYTYSGGAWSKTGTFPLLTSPDSLVSSINQAAGKIESSVIQTGVNQTLESYITQLPGEISLSVRGGYANEWAVGVEYFADDVVKVTSTSNNATILTFYRCKENHTSSAGSKPPYATYWEEIPDANIQSMIDMNLNGLTLAYDASGAGSTKNASFIKLTKDGVQLAGQKIVMSNVEADTLTANAVSAIRLNADQITAGTLSADRIGANSITAAKIASETITANEIAAGAIGTDQLAANAVTAGKIAAGEVTGDKIEANVVLTAPVIDGGTFYGNVFNIMPEKDSQGHYIDQSGSMNIYGTAGYNQLYHFYKVAYATDSFGVPNVKVYSPDGSSITFGHSGTGTFNVYCRSWDFDPACTLSIRGRIKLEDGYNYGTLAQRNSIQNPSTGQLFFVI